MPYNKSILLLTTITGGIAQIICRNCDQKTMDPKSKRYAFVKFMATNGLLGGLVVGTGTVLVKEGIISFQTLPASPKVSPSRSFWKHATSPKAIASFVGGAVLGIINVLR